MHMRSIRAISRCFVFFRDVLGVDARVANQDACMMEHYLSEETLTKLKRFVERLLEGGE